jgi:hypothetical protein
MTKPFVYIDDENFIFFILLPNFASSDDEITFSVPLANFNVFCEARIIRWHTKLRQFLLTVYGRPLKVLFHSIVGMFQPCPFGLKNLGIRYGKRTYPFTTKI